jgi:carbon storage regulator
MLVLSRKKDQRIQIGKDVWLTVIGVQGGRVRLGFEAPDDVLILRDELPRNDSANSQSQGTV